MFGRQLPQWFGRQGAAPPVDPSIWGMMPQAGQQPIPQAPQLPQQAQFTPTAAPPAQAPLEVGPDREAAMRQQMLADAMQKQYGSRENVNSPLTAGLYALNQGLGSYLDKQAADSKTKVESADRKALIAALNSADPMAALGTLDSEAAQNAFIQMKMQGMGPKTEPVDVNNDGRPDFLKDPKGNLTPYPQTAEEAQRAQIDLYNQTTGREGALNRAQQARLAAEKKPTGPDPEKEGAFRKEFITGAKDFVAVRDAYGRIEASAKDPSAAGDLSLIFNYMKVLDPGSTVREGEFATAQNATGVPQRILNAYNNVISGERLNASQRNDFVGRAGKLYEKQLDSFKKTSDLYKGIAGQYGYDPSRAVPDLSLGMRPAPAATTSPPPRISSPEALQALPPGTKFIAPDGSIRVKQ